MKSVKIETRMGRSAWLINKPWNLVGIGGHEFAGVTDLITDPPYGIQADKANAHSSIRDNPEKPEKSWDAARPPDTHLRMLGDSKRSHGRRVAIWGGNYFADCLPPSPGWLVWRKPEAETGFSLADAELCWTTEAFAVRCKTFARRDQEPNLHPTQKPVAIMAWTMEVMKAGAVILDPYMGSGTTGIAAWRTGRDFIGIEADEEYFDKAVERFREEAHQLLI